MNNPRTYLDNIYPYVLFAQKYCFAEGQTSGPRICYVSSIVLIEEGRGKLLMNSQGYEAKPGVLFYIPPGKKHCWEAAGTNPMIHRCAYFDWKYMQRPDFTHQNDYFCFEVDTFRPEYLGPHLDVNIAEHSLVKDINVWLSRFDRFTSSPELLDERNFPESLEIRGYFQLFLHHFIKFTLKPTSLLDPRIQKTIGWMNELSQNVTEQTFENIIDLCAKRNGISRSHFHALFKEQTGVSPKAYWNNNILLRTKDDLKYTDLSITDIAAKYGFSSIHYFSKIFHKQMECTPTEYRNRNRIY